jgi:hypothetical protein
MGIGLAAGSFGLNRFGSKITQKLPGPVRDAIGIGLNFRRFKEPQLSYKWEFLLPKLDFSNASKRNAEDKAQIAAGDILGDFTPTIVGVTLPFGKLEKEEVFINASTMYLPVSTSVGSLTLRVLQESDGKALYYFEYWKSMVFTPSGKVRYMTEYKRDLKCNLLDYTNGGLNEVSLTGCFPTDISSLSLAYDSSDAMYFEVEMSVDQVPLHTLQGNLLAFNNITSALKSAAKQLPVVGSLF